MLPHMCMRVGLHYHDCTSAFVREHPEWAKYPQ